MLSHKEYNCYNTLSKQLKLTEYVHGYVYLSGVVQIRIARFITVVHAKSL